MRSSKGKIKFGICTISIYASTGGMYALPIVSGNGGISVHIITVYIEQSCNTCRLGVFPVIGPGLKNTASHIRFGSRPEFIVIVHHIVAAPFARVTAVAAPIVNNVITEIHFFEIGPVGVATAAETGIATVVMRQHIVVKTGPFSAPNTAIAVRALTMNRFPEAFTQNTPLHGKIGIIVKRSTFIGTPAHGAMIDNDV